MKVNIRNCLIAMSFFYSITHAENHPLWVGFDCNDYPRTPGIQGPITKDFIHQFLPTNPIIVEAGAYNGEDTYEMATLWPTATIYAFEPVPHLLERVKIRCAHLPNVTLFQQALSNKNGTFTLYLSSGDSDGSSSLLQPALHLKDHPGVLFKQEISVQATTLDDWAKKHNVNKVDLLWLDMQCLEPAMLESSPVILRTVKVIMTEVNLTELYHGCILYPEFKQWLEPQGFEVKREELPWRNGGNVLFVRK